MNEFNLKGVITDCIDVEANAEAGFNFPFKIVIPRNRKNSSELVYVCNILNDIPDNCSSFDELIEYTKKDFKSIDPMHSYLCLEKGYPMIIPFIPQFNDFRPNFLGKEFFKNDFKRFENSKFKDYFYKYENLADQHKAIMTYAIKLLNEKNIYVDSRLIICGYSEGAKFASHFALLHPEIIKAVIAGGTGGIISMPVSKIGNYTFNYPTGIADVPNFDKNSFKKISFFYYIGNKDKSDPAIPNFDDYHYLDSNGKDCILKDECGHITPHIDKNGKPEFKLDENGNYSARFNTLFSDEEVNVINKVLGTIPQERFKKQEDIYKNCELGLNAVFNTYSGDHISIFDNKKLIFKDVDNFIETYIEKKPEKRL